VVSKSPSSSQFPTMGAVALEHPDCAAGDLVETDELLAATPIHLLLGQPMLAAPGDAG
jgi:hypothetical protein